ncbi:helix-turn-helix domain-containing protein [Streptomyces sp. NPDC056159]|uniref:helix-turn-helix domain-containing protein n=1 Tax=Streptomyces sp. NPDC056159 TaxID=3155537 RepID=UPI003447C784
MTKEAAELTSSPKTTRWRRLPQELPAACVHLVTALRGLKDSCGLNLAELGKATAISRSSWERYLNGKQFPPRQAVQALCQVTQQDEDKLLAWWALADSAWSGRGQTASPHASADTGPDISTSQTTPHSPARAMLLAASRPIDEHPMATATAVLLLCAAMITPAAVVYASRANELPTVGRPPVCRLHSCDGRKPRRTACEDPTTSASYTAADGTRLEIRLSPICQAGWIRAWPTHRSFRIVITGPDAQAQSTTAMPQPTDPPDSAGREVVTSPMIAAPRPAELRACYYPSVGSPGRECFGGTQSQTLRTTLPQWWG